MDTATKQKLRSKAIQLSEKYKIINKLELLLSDINRRNYENQQLKNEINSKELLLKKLDTKLEKLTIKCENQINHIENFQLNLAADRRELEVNLVKNTNFIKGEFMDVIKTEVQPKQEALCKDLINIYPTSSEFTQFLDVKMPLKAELTIHQASWLIEQEQVKDNSFFRRKRTKKLQLNDLIMTQFVGEQLVRLLLTEKYILDWPLRFPISLLSNVDSNLEQKPESGGIVQNSQYKNIKIASYNKRDRIEFLDGIALLHCNFFDLEWIAKDKGTQMVLTKGHTRKFWKIIESSMEINKNQSDNLSPVQSPSNVVPNSNSNNSSFNEFPMIIGLYNGGNMASDRKNRLVDRSKLIS